MKPSDVKLIMKIQKLKLVILLGYQNIKTFLQKYMFLIGMNTFLWLKRLKTLYRGHMLFVIVRAKKLLECSLKNNQKLLECSMQKTNQKEFRVEKVIQRKGDRLYVKWKGYYSSFNSSIDEKT